MGLDRIDEALQPLGVTEIVCDGKSFDPKVMKAADIEETGKVPDGTVLEVYRTGYMIDAEILQPAEVKVARAPRSE
jgi:molecular chaperone GrpE